MRKDVVYPLRVFVSYAHEDLPLAKEYLIPALSASGLIPVWDEAIEPGTRFADAIKKQIATAHLFMPVLTDNSIRNSWVNQEIGFAVGIDIPVLPVSLLEHLPTAMLEGIQTLRIGRNCGNLQDEFQSLNLDELVVPRNPVPELQRLSISTQVADIPEERTRLLVELAGDVAGPGLVRQRALFSSFSLPDASATDPAWDDIDMGRNHYSDLQRRRLREERRILFEKASCNGCKLIISPFVDRDRQMAGANLPQLRNLKAFINAMRSDQLVVAISERRIEGNLTLAGDWFGAKALPPQPGAGYRQTVFCRHAPTVLRWLRDFDRDLEEILRDQNLHAAASRDAALSYIDRLLQSNRCPSTSELADQPSDSQ